MSEKTTNRDASMLLEDIRDYPDGLPVAVEMWDDIASPGCDEPAVRAFYDGEAGYAVIELLRRQPKGGPYSPLGMGVRADMDRDGWASEAVVPEGTLDIGTLRQVLRSTGSAEGVFLRIWTGDDPEETDEGVYTVMEYPLQDSIYEGTEGDELGKTFDAYGHEMPPGEGRVAYVVLNCGEQFSSGR